MQLFELFEFKSGSTVVKKSGKPFKNGEKEDIIDYFCINSEDPKKRKAAFLKNSQTVVNLSQMTLKT